jgi:hypothetical protein
VSHEFTRIHKEMPVYDRNGDKLGTVGEVYLTTGVTTPGSLSGAVGYSERSSRLERNRVGRVYKGYTHRIPGLVKSVYIVAHAIAHVDRDRVSLDIDCDSH